MATDGGFIRISRKIMKWGWYTDVPTCKLFMHLVLKANFTEGKFKDIIVERGQTVTSYGHLAEETGLSVQQVRTAINKLLSTQEITQDATSSYQVITLCNYDTYNPQGKITNKVSNTLSNNQITNDQQTDNKQVTTIEEEEESKEEEDKYSDDSRELELSSLLYTLMTANNDKTKKPNLQSWAEDIDKLHRIDGNSYDDIEQLIRWTQQDSFEKTNILSPAKLRKRFPQLWLKGGKKKIVSKEANQSYIDDLSNHFK